MPEPLRVFVYARYPTVRAGLRELATAAGIEVVADLEGEAADAGRLLADVILAEVGEGDEATAEALEVIDASGLPAAVLVARLPSDAFDAPAPRAWLGPGAGAEQIGAALRLVATGMLAVDPALARERRVQVAADEGEGARLTEREAEVLGLVALGLPNKAIARRLAISEHTVKYHVASVLSKLGSRSRAEAVATAVRQGMLRL